MLTSTPVLGTERKCPPWVCRRPEDRQRETSGHIANLQLPVGSPWPRNRRNLPSHCGGEQVSRLQALITRRIVCLSLGGFPCEVPQRHKAGDSVGAQSMLKHGMPDSIQNLAVPSKFQNCLAASTGFQSFILSSASNPDQILPCGPSSPRPCNPPAPLLAPLPASSSLYAVQGLRHPSQNPVPFGGWPTIPLLEATCAYVFGFWLTGDQKNKIYHLTVLFFFISFHLFPPKNEVSIFKLCSEFQTWQATGKSISSFSEGRNATVNNKKKKRIPGIYEGRLMSRLTSVSSYDTAIQGVKKDSPAPPERWRD